MLSLLCVTFMALVASTTARLTGNTVVSDGGGGDGDIRGTPRADATCVPGSSWQHECNSCFCSNAGLPACTMIDCSAMTGNSQQQQQRSFGDFYRPPSPPAAEPLERRTGTCVENATWTEQCNQCACLATNLAVCTKMTCADEPDAENQQAASAASGGCRVGDTWSHGCMQCHCLPNSQVVCMHTHCRNSGRHNSGVRAKEVRRIRRQARACVPGEHRKVDCNTCVCLADGSEACTRSFCPRPVPTPYSASASASAGGRSNGGGGGCIQLCPADCGQRRLPSGCLQCQCGPQPFFAAPQPTFSSRDDRGGFAGYYGGRIRLQLPHRLSNSWTNQLQQRARFGIADEDGWTRVGK